MLGSLSRGDGEGDESTGLHQAPAGSLQPQDVCLETRAVGETCWSLAHTDPTGLLLAELALTRLSFLSPHYSGGASTHHTPLLPSSSRTTERGKNNATWSNF